MAPKKAAGTTSKKAAAPSHGSYKDMIKEAILNLKERNGSSRQAIKKYVQANNKIPATGATFDAQFNKAIKSGVEKGDFTQPKGASGPVKLAKKEPKPAAKPVKKTEKKATTTKKSAAPKKEKAEKKPATKKAAAPKKAPASKTKANTAKPRAKKASKPADAPAVVDAPKVLTKTKSGRVAKTKAPTAKKAAPKKAAPKKAAAKKSATPKAEAAA